MLRAMQLKEDECNFKKTLSDHCSEVLRNKKVLVVDEMIKCMGMVTRISLKIFRQALI